MNSNYGCFVYQKFNDEYELFKGKSKLKLLISVQKNLSKLDDNFIGEQVKFVLSENKACEWRLHITPDYLCNHIGINCNRFSYAQRKFIGCTENVFEELDLTLVFSFDRITDLVIQPHHHFIKHHPLSCVIPKTKNMVHIVNMGQFIRP
jgi:hypothetical protein